MVVEKEKFDISKCIHTVRGKLVILDKDLAYLYDVTTGRLNEAVKRNSKRFPNRFMFQLEAKEYESLISQFAISNSHTGRGGRRNNPYAFTEHGIAMLASVLKSDTAIDVSIQIIDKFVELKNIFNNNQEVFLRIANVEGKQAEMDARFKKVFDYITVQEKITQKIFFDGQVYDAFSLIVDLIKTAKKKIIIIDNYVDVSTLNLLCKKNSLVDILIITSKNSALSKKDIEVFNRQYPNLKVSVSGKFHDRFIIIDEREGYHVGASLKDAGKKSFAITKIESQELLYLLLKYIN